MAAAQKAAALDLCRRLGEVSGVEAVVKAPAEDVAAFAELGAATLSGTPGEFHFGSELAGLAAQRGWDRLAYFGAASAPLLSADRLSAIFEQARALPGRSALVNNLHSTDWMVLNDSSALGA
jgi:hypothetical protein